ncbi:hypothetical protein Zmor_028430 [Zophobas morio]|uniref:Uncharacterized protein n=1 Tax=Zophobas morio TaxID=2755281 RepID=A0AA38M4A0_9CUCU|nr:hypothetical protein Zmor_028430 [Zophobas morio]
MEIFNVPILVPRRDRHRRTAESPFRRFRSTIYVEGAPRAPGDRRNRKSRFEAVTILTVPCLFRRRFLTRKRLPIVPEGVKNRKAWTEAHLVEASSRWRLRRTSERRRPPSVRCSTFDKVFFERASGRTPCRFADSRFVEKYSNKRRGRSEAVFRPSNDKEAVVTAKRERCHHPKVEREAADFERIPSKSRV